MWWKVYQFFIKVSWECPFFPKSACITTRNGGRLSERSQAFLPAPERKKDKILKGFRTRSLWEENEVPSVGDLRKLESASVNFEGWLLTGSLCFSVLTASSDLSCAWSSCLTLMLLVNHMFSSLLTDFQLLAFPDPLAWFFSNHLTCHDIRFQALTCRPGQHGCLLASVTASLFQLPP